MRRDFCDWYLSAQGQILKKNELEYLKKEVVVGYRQTVVQIGGLGWENDYIDVSSYPYFFVVDTDKYLNGDTKKIFSVAEALPFSCNSIDFIILPHLLEFEENCHQVLREIERVLKPEGHLIILGLNPWSLLAQKRFFWGKRTSFPWGSLLLRRSKVLDWLSLLNFKARVSAHFHIRSLFPKIPLLRIEKRPVISVGYAIKAIKRRYTLIPLKSYWIRKTRLAVACMADPKAINKIHK